tara:strand:+ start:176 stop:469 length:294 start_codon:yes stop_codon:yes gene_type:complete
LLNVTVVYALPQELFQEVLELCPGSRVRDALAHSGVLEAFPEIDVESVPLGIFSRRVELDTPLTEGDRVEIYRPLKLSPTDARRLRAERRRVSRPKA